MYACLECGKRLPPRARGGHREREYCSHRCRQRAYRKLKKQKQEIERLITGAYPIPVPDSRADRESWRFERGGLLAHCKLVEAECHVLQAEVKVLEDKRAILEDDVKLLRSILADKDAEIVRLNILLESYGKRKR